MQADESRARARPWLVSAGATLAAGAIGFAWNRYPVIVGDGLWMVYGSIPALLAAMSFGPWAGLVAGFLAGLATVTSWGQPVGLTLYTIEAVVVGLASRRALPSFKAAFAADGLFWAVLGIPAVAVYGLYVRDFGPGITWLVIAKYVANASFYLTVALLLTHSVVGRWIAPWRATGSDPLEAMLYRAVALSAILPFLVAQTFFAQIARRDEVPHPALAEEADRRGLPLQLFADAQLVHQADRKSTRLNSSH